jgi:TRAP-type C4-dicarboxylate transport system substrate-binding protein
VQQIIIEACKMGGARTRETAAKANTDAIEFMTKRGHKVTRPDPKPFEALVPAVYKRFSAQVGQDLINEVIAAQK